MMQFIHHTDDSWIIDGQERVSFVQRLFLLLVLFLPLIASPASAKTGTATNNFGGNPYCVELSERESRYLRDICMTELEVMWNWNVVLGGAVEEYKGAWRAADTVALTGLGRVPVGSLPAVLETAYAKIKPANFVAHSGVISSSGSAIVYYRLDLEASGKKPFFSVPGSRGWENLLGLRSVNNAPERLCEPGGMTRRPDLAEPLGKDEARRVFMDVVRLEPPGVCSVRFNGVSTFNLEVDKHCRETGPEGLNGVCAIYCAKNPYAEKCKKPKEEPAKAAAPAAEEELAGTDAEDAAVEDPLADLFDRVIEEEMGDGETGAAAPAEDPFAAMLAEEEARAAAERAEAERKAKEEAERQRLAKAAEEKKKQAAAEERQKSQSFIKFKVNSTYIVNGEKPTINESSAWNQREIAAFTTFDGYFGAIYLGADILPGSYSSTVGRERSKFRFCMDNYNRVPSEFDWDKRWRAKGYRGIGNHCSTRSDATCGKSFDRPANFTATVTSVEELDGKVYAEGNFSGEIVAYWAVDPSLPCSQIEYKAENSINITDGSFRMIWDAKRP